MLGQLQARFNTNPGSPVVGVVRLSGLVHAADRVAFREIARQLCGCDDSPSCFLCNKHVLAGLSEAHGAVTHLLPVEAAEV